RPPPTTPHFFSVSLLYSINYSFAWGGRGGGAAGCPKYALAQSGGKKCWYGSKELRITREMKQCFN
ncbi:hypothetical protein, partial [Escherichia ruysiae]|uniref:hypothetical protein n=1 Tax=Escherichia ruysiae TaxID=2608867 RepID=UPI001C9BAD55